MRLRVTPTLVLLSALALALAGCSTLPDTPPAGQPTSHSSAAATSTPKAKKAAPASTPKPAKTTAASTPDPAPTPQITAAADGTCQGMTASWTPMLSDASGISVLIYAYGLLTVQVMEGSTTTATKTVTVSMADTPYSIEVTGVHPSAITEVDLFSLPTDGQAAAHCKVPQG
ncbi:hypothetical protein [Leifsonia sp. EB34]|uniref:hypothetical protein n=1 Tax=Leifsonia sp. EB34 TaxID=3156303 RepID=UPI0035113772